MKSSCRLCTLLIYLSGLCNNEYSTCFHEYTNVFYLLLFFSLWYFVCCLFPINVYTENRKLSVHTGTRTWWKSKLSETDLSDIHNWYTRTFSIYYGRCSIRKYSLKSKQIEFDYSDVHNWYTRTLSKYYGRCSIRKYLLKSKQIETDLSDIHNWYSRTFSTVNTVLWEM